MVYCGADSDMSISQSLMMAIAGAAQANAATCVVQGNPSNTKLLIHSDTTDGSTTFTDSSSGRTITVNGGVQHDIAQSQLGMSSIYFDGNGDYLTIPGSTDFQFGTGDFTVDLWVKYNTIITSVDRLICNIDEGNYSWELRYSTFNGVQWAVSTTGGPFATQTFSFATTLSPDTWIHFAITRENGNLRAFINGTQIGVTQTDNNSYYPSIGDITVGAAPSGMNDFDGWLDEVRIVKGEAKWTSSFTPPALPYCDGS
jgi:hypothetical protein